MTTTSDQPWIPKTDSEKAAKAAFDGLNASLDSVVMRTNAGVPAKFILHSQGYFGLKNYVLTGKTFPKNNDEFEKSITKDAFQRLTDADPNIYTTTRSTLVAIGSTCSDFAKENLASLVTVAQEAIQYSDNATLWLSGMEDVNLHAQLQILLDSKYTSKDKEDDAYRTAFDLATASLTVLREEALQRQGATKKVLDALLTFENATVQNKKDMALLIQQFQDGPVKQNTVTSEPFLSYLNKDITEKKAAVLDQIAKRDEMFKTWAMQTGIEAGSFGMPFIGWIATAATTGFEKTARQQLDELSQTVSKSQKDNQEETNLIDFVSKTVTQGRNIEGKMTAAIAAMQELHDLFTAQSNHYSSISTALSGMRTGVTLHSLDSRRSFVNAAMKTALNKLKDLKTVAQEFVNSAVHTIDMTQPK